MEIDHDAAPGPLKHCQITGSSELHQVIDLGHQPPCDALLTEAQLDMPESTYPLRMMFCPESGLAQLDFVLPGELVYPPSYPYKAGISWPVVHAHKAMASDLVQRFGPGFYVDVGSNDGTLLAALQQLGCTVLGVEPTDVAQLAQVETLQEFFSHGLADLIIADRDRPTCVTMTNVFAHMAQLGETMRALNHLMGDQGVFVTESHYLLDVLQKNQFDTIYHEHVRTYSLKALVCLFAQYDMEVFDVQRPSRYAGNIRAYVGRRGRRAVSERVPQLLAVEEAACLHRMETWVAFKRRVLRARDHFGEFMHRVKREGARVAGNSAPGRATPLLNFYGVTPDDLPYLGELPGSLKIGKYQPGTHIPIEENSRIRREQPDYLVLLAWHYAGPIVDRLAQEGVRSQLVVPLPDFTILKPGAA